MAEESGFENIGGMYVEIQARTEKLEKELRELREKLAKSAKELSAISNVKPNVDDRLAKMKISDLRKEYHRLRDEFSKQLELDVRADKLKAVRQQIKDVEKTLQEAGVNIRKVPEDVDNSSNRFIDRIKRLTSAASALFGGALSGLGTYFGVKTFLQKMNESITLAKEQAKAEAQVEQAIRQTGGAAGFTARELFKEASALQQLTGVGDEVSLQGITKQLLTFTNVTGDNFKRAQKAVLDLNAVINDGNVSGLTSQSIQLGKALENPIQGISALTRSGVTFTEQQKELIKSLVQSGRMFEAQAIILDEIDAKYGGQAEALAKAEAGTKQMTAAFGDFLERVGNKLLPTIATTNEFLTRFFNNLLSDAPKTFADELSSMNKAAIEQVQQFDRLTSTYKDLRSQTGLTTEKKKVLKKTIDDLQKLYPNYLKNIDLETGKLDDVEKGFDNARIALKKYLDQKIALAIADDKQTEIIDIGKELYVIEQARANFKAAVEQAYQTGIFNGVRFEDQKQLQQAIDVQTRLMDDGLQGRVKLIEERRESLQAEVAKIQETTAKLFEAPKNANNSGNDSIIKLPKLGDVKPVDPKDLFPKTEFDKAVGVYSEGQKKVFEEAKFAADGYFAYRIQQIHRETDESIKAGATKASAEQAAMAKLKAFYAEYFAYLAQKEDERLTRSQQSLLALFEGQQENFDVLTAGFDSISDGFNEAMSNIRISADAANTALEKGFIGMANTFIAQVSKMLTKWAAFQVVTAVAGSFGLKLPASITGIASKAGGDSTPVPTGATGGRFAGTSTGIKRLASGGSFVVPPGFQNDGYPLRVQSGEKVSVTPAGAVADQNRVFYQIKHSIESLNQNLMTHRNKFEFRASLAGAVKGRDLQVSYERQKRVNRKAR